METKSVNKLAILAFVGMSFVILILCCAIVLVFLVRQQDINFASVLSLSTETPTPTSTPTATLTPSPTATITLTPTITPTPEPINYEFEDVCMKVNAYPVYLYECVTSVTILPNGNMQFNFLWRIDAPPNKGIRVYPDTGNRKMYITDSLGNRIDHIETGGGANETVTLFPNDLLNPSFKEGWFLFPPADPGAIYFIFHDDDNGVQTGKIQRIWP